METAKPLNQHIGRKISRIRELRGIKQEAFATELGVSQQTVSRIEQSQDVEADVLDKIADILGVTSEGIKNFNEEAVFNIIGNNYHDSSSSVQYQCTFNPIDKLIEVFEENKKLYEQLLASEREKVEILKNSK
jgi:transcriptional regulator with XRE-family HTH domain